MTTLDTTALREALAARIAVERDDYLLASIVRGVIRERRSWSRRRLLDELRSLLGYVGADDVAKVLAAYEACGYVVAHRVRGRRVRYSSAHMSTRPRRSKSPLWHAAQERRHAIVAMVRSWPLNERDAFYRAAHAAQVDIARIASTL